MKNGFSAILQPVVDILVQVDHDFLVAHNLKPGGYSLVERDAQDKLLAATSGQRIASSGGAVSNSIACASILGIKSSYYGLIADDEYGNLYRKEFNALGVTSSNTPVANSQTGTCLSLITPDGERTMTTHLGVALELNETHIDGENIRASEWLLLEGHLLTAGAKNTRALLQGIEIANRSRTKVVLNTNSELAARSKRDEILLHILPKIDLLIANEPEAMALAEEQTVQAAFTALVPSCKTLVVTCGKEGALIQHEGQHVHVPPYTEGITPVDSTGAGDVFLGAFVSGLALGYPVNMAGRGAARLAALAVGKSGARLPKSAIQLWEDAIK